MKNELLKHVNKVSYKFLNELLTDENTTIFDVDGKIWGLSKDSNLINYLENSKYEMIMKKEGDKQLFISKPLTEEYFDELIIAIKKLKKEDE